MSVLEPTTHVRGEPLPFSTYEDQPVRAVERGMDMIKDWCAAAGLTTSKLIGDLERTSLGVACAASFDVVEELALVDYSIFARLSASLWQLRAHPDFVPVVRTLLTTEDPDSFAHDECLLFLASKLLVARLSVRPAAQAGYGITNPDLVATNASIQAGDVFFELKERSPTAARDAAALSTYIAKKIGKCSEQIRERDPASLGFAVVDLGRVKEEEIPDVLSLVMSPLEAHGNLYGALICSTLCKCHQTDDGNFFVPVFRSHMVDVHDRVNAGDTRLAPSTIEALHRALKPKREA